MRSERVDAADATAACARMTQQASRESVWLGLNTHQPPIDNDSSTRPAEHTTPHSTPLCISLLAGPTDQTRQSLNRVTPAGRSIIATLCTDSESSERGPGLADESGFCLLAKIVTSQQSHTKRQAGLPEPNLGTHNPSSNKQASDAYQPKWRPCRLYTLYTHNNSIRRRNCTI